MQYIEAPKSTKVKWRKTVFLAGGITSCRDWQSDIVSMIRREKIDVTVFNPRRKRFPIDKPNEALRQIRWEFKKLHLADIITFWFSKETMCPIVLWECAAALERWKADSGQTLIIGCDPEYTRLQDVQIQTGLISKKIKVYIGFDKFSNRLKRELRNYQDASDWLQRLGVVTKKGRLTKPYRAQ